MRITSGLWALLIAANAIFACEGPEYRQFDFWLGQWTVYTVDGKVAGENDISLREDGCVLQEQYVTAGGYKGESLNIYDKSRQRWHQTWVDNQGGLLQLDGGLRNGVMVLEGMAFIAPDTERLNRISWTPNPDGTVRQHWQYQEPSGEWKTVFDGLYKRRQQ